MTAVTRRQTPTTVTEMAMPPIIPPMTSGNVTAPRMAPRGSPAQERGDLGHRDGDAQLRLQRGRERRELLRDERAAAGGDEDLGLLAQHQGAVGLAGLDEVDGGGAVGGGDDLERAGGALVEPLRDRCDRGGGTGDGDRAGRAART